MGNYNVCLINEDGSQLVDKKGYPQFSRIIDAQSVEDAYKDFVESNMPFPFARVSVTWGLMGKKFFDPPHYEGQMQVEVELKEEEWQNLSIIQKQQKEALELTLELTRKIKSEGFQVLNKDEVETIGGVLDEVLTSNTESEEKLNLAKVTIMDEQAYKFYTLRSNTRSSLQQQAMLKAMNVNLSQISSKTSGVKMASMFTGMAAARHLGEEMAEDFGGED